jgi:hypothetical protein
MAARPTGLVYREPDCEAGELASERGGAFEGASAVAAPGVVLFPGELLRLVTSDVNPVSAHAANTQRRATTPNMLHPRRLLVIPVLLCLLVVRDICSEVSADLAGLAKLTGPDVGNVGSSASSRWLWTLSLLMRF